MRGVHESHQEPPTNAWPRRRKWAALLLALVSIGVLATVFLPIGWQLNRFVVWVYYQGRGVGISFISIQGYEFLLNMVLFALPAWLAAMVWPRVPWWAWSLLAFVASTGIELTQGRFLPRNADWLDVVANTGGALLATATLATWGNHRASDRG